MSVTKIAVFASGRGSNFQVVYQRIKDGYIPAEIALLISDNPHAGALAFAAAHDIPCTVIRPKDFATPEMFGEELLHALLAQQIEFIVLAGYLKKIPGNVVQHYANRIVNIHPALLPAFGGRGMYGIRVHEAVFLSGAKISGLTVHLVNDEYDAGPIVLQKAVAIDDCNSPADIARKVLEVEHQALPEAIKLLLENSYAAEDNRVILGKRSYENQTGID